MANPVSATAVLDTEFKRGLGLYDSTMVVVGSMIGSGIGHSRASSRTWLTCGRPPGSW